MKNLRYWIYPLLFFTWVAASSAEELPVVAIAEFESGMGTYQSQLFASNLASQAQAAMANSDAMRLVERAQLELAATELALEPYLKPRVGESLAVGRWVGADLIMLGTLDRDPEGAWTLALEVDHEVRLLRFPRVRHVQAEMELRLDGLAEMTRRRPARPPVFIWGGLRESDAKGKTPEEVPLRAFLSIRTHGIEAKEIQLSGTVGEARALMTQLVRSMIGHAKQQSREPVISPGPNPAEAEEMMRHIKRLEDEFDIRLRSKEATETLSSLGI